MFLIASFFLFLLTGDMMGPFIDNLEGKIRMPSGCGEQNIMSLTPSMFVAKYLKAINRYEQEVEAKVGKVCGFGREAKVGKVCGFGRSIIQILFFYLNFINLTTIM